MGVIKRQGIKNSIVNYFGVLIGAVSSIFIYPLINERELGMLRFTVDTAILFAPLASLAMSITAVQYFPTFKDEKRQHNGFLFLLTSACIVFSLIFCTIIYTFKNPISDFFNTEKSLFLNTLPYILIFTIFIALSNLYLSYAMNFNRIVVPAIFHNLLLKIAQPILVFLFAGGVISFVTLFKGVGISLLLMTLGLVGYIGFLGQLYLKPDFSKASPQLLKEMLSYSGFSVLVTFGGILTQRMDAMLVAPMLGFSAAAVFGFGSFVAEAIDVPRKALSSIAAPLISESVKSGNIPHVEEIYRKTALLQLIIGLFLLVGVWVCADALFDLMPRNGDVFRQSKWVILLLGLARVVDMATGTNAEIITYSEFYRFNFRSFLVLAALNLGLNLLLIPLLGMIGSALATLIAITLVNLWRLFFIKSQLNIHPLDKAMLWVMLFALAGYGAGFFTPSVTGYDSSFLNAFLTILLKGSVVTLVYATLIIVSKVSSDVNKFFR